MSRSKMRCRSRIVFWNIFIALFLVFVLNAAMARFDSGMIAATLPSLAHNPQSNLAYAQHNTHELQIDSTCDTVSNIPVSECNLLVRIYSLTNGDQWFNNTGWLTINDRVTPCDWFGVTCSNGHVTGLELPSNGLTGELPGAIALFPEMKRLLLNDNQLQGSLPLAMCDLASRLESIDVNFNQLRPLNERAKQCLDRLTPDWLETQTIPPFEISAVEITTNTVEIQWTPIPNSTDGAYYEISYATSLDQPRTVHGTTDSTGETGYVLDGLAIGESYLISVRTFTPAQPGQQNAQFSAYATTVAVTESTMDDVLVLVYFPADNDLSPYVPSVLRKLQFGSRVNPNVQVLILTDGAGDEDTKLFAISDGNVVESTAIEEEWGRTELDTMDPAVLSWFLRYGRSSYTASKTVVSIMGHGAGHSPEFAWEVRDSSEALPKLHKGIPPLPKGLDYTPGDLSDNGGFLSTLDLASALNEATDNGAEPFDVVFFDQCFQGNLDVLYEMKNTAQVFIGSPNYAWLSAPYHRYIPALTPTQTPEQMARVIIRIYQNSLNAHHPNAVFWATSSDIEDVADVVSELGTALVGATIAGQEELILQASLNGKYVDTTQCGRQNLILGPPDELQGAGTFARNLIRLFPENSQVATAAEQVVEALENIEGNAQVGQPYLAPDAVWDYDETFTILAPLRRNSSASVVWRASIYTETVPIRAKWSVVPTQTVHITNTFAFVEDKEWDEFINVWYTNDLEPTVGDWCHYIPPVIVSDITTETLSLDVAALGDDLELKWDETTQNRAVEYVVMARRAEGNWRTLFVSDLGQNSYRFTPADQGHAYEFMVVAQSEDGLAVAQSDEALFETSVPTPIDPNPNGQTYLPWITR